MRRATEWTLDETTHNRIYVQRVLPGSEFHRTTPQKHPCAVMLAGQPGAGKGGLADATRGEFGGNVVTLDLDETRQFHPRIDELREQFPYTWADHTHQDARGWTDKLTHDLVEGRRNIVFDTTLGGADHWIGEMKRMQSLKTHPYEVELRVLATHRLESELGVHKRFTRDLDAKGHGRFVPETVRRSVYESLPANLDKVHTQLPEVRIRIYNREGQELYDSRTSRLKPGAALEQAREGRLTEPRRTHDLRDMWHAQNTYEQKLHETLKQNANVPSSTAQNVLHQNAEIGIKPDVARGASEVVSIDYAVRVEPAARAAKLCLKVAADAAVAVDAYTTGRETARLLDQDNLTGAQSHVLHFGGRNAGMVAGAVTGARIGAALGVESGPALFATGAIGGVAGAVLGDRAMDVVDQARIHTQQGSDGHTWQSDPWHPERGWTRHAPAYGTNAQGRATYEMQTLRADARSSSELDYKASNTAVELALAYAPNPKNPFSQPPEAIGEQVLAGIGANDPWTRDPQSRTWTRQAIEPATPMTHGMPVQRTVTANAEQSRQLDAAARATIAENITRSRQGIAQQYQSTYDERGWKQHGPVPAAVLNAERTPPTQQRASDGRDYTQGQNGQWTTPGTLYGTNIAQRAVRDELNATKQQAQHTTAPAPIYDKHDARIANAASASSSASSTSAAAAPALAQQSHLADAKARHAPATYDKRLTESRPVSPPPVVPTAGARERDNKPAEREAPSTEPVRQLAAERERELNRSAQADAEQARQTHAALERNQSDERELAQARGRTQEQERAREQERVQTQTREQERELEQRRPEFQQHALPEEHPSEHPLHAQQDTQPELVAQPSLEHSEQVILIAQDTHDDSTQRDTHPQADDLGVNAKQHPAEALDEQDSPRQPWHSLQRPDQDAEQRTSPLAISEKDHPGNALYEQALAGLQKYNAEHRIEIPGESTSNMAAALAVEAASNGLKRIDFRGTRQRGRKALRRAGQARPSVQRGDLSVHHAGDGNPVEAKLRNV